MVCYWTYHYPWLLLFAGGTKRFLEPSGRGRQMFKFFPHSGKPQNRDMPHLCREPREGDAY